MKTVKKSINYLLTIGGTHHHFHLKSELDAHVRNLSSVKIAIAKVYTVRGKSLVEMSIVRTTVVV